MLCQGSVDIIVLTTTDFTMKDARFVKHGHSSHLVIGELIPRHSPFTLWTVMKHSCRPSTTIQVLTPLP